MSGSRGRPNRAPTPMELTEQLKGIPAATPARSELPHKDIEEVRKAELSATKGETNTWRGFRRLRVAQESYRHERRLARRHRRSSTYGDKRAAKEIAPRSDTHELGYLGTHSIVSRRSIQRLSQLIHQVVNLLKIADQRRRHEHGITGLANHESQVVRGIATVHCGRRSRCRARR